MKLVQDSDDSESPYRSADGFVMQREYEGLTPNGNPIGGRWVLRDIDGRFMDVDQYRYDLAPRNGFST